MLDGQRIGWIGAGRMGLVIAARLISAGAEVSVWNRTRAKAKPLEDIGARIVDHPADLAALPIVVTMVSDSAVFEQVTMGVAGLFSPDEVKTEVLIDSSTISSEASDRVRRYAADRGCALLAAPVSGNPKVAKAGRLAVVASGPEDAFQRAEPILAAFGQHVSFVGDDDRARLVKICHNLILGAMAQILAETTVLAERGGISRTAYLEFINNGALGSMFSRYKTPALVGRDYTPTFTSHLLRKDLELGLAAARELDVTLPATATVHQLVTHLSNSQYADGDFAALIELAASAAGYELEPEEVTMSDGLQSTDEAG
jgi:3-hydroxyisobutyrate dehydrogenase